MTENKTLLASKTVWGAVLMLAAVVLNYFGITLSPEDQLQIIDVIVTLVGAAGSLLAIFGRIVATRKIGS